MTTQGGKPLIYEAWKKFDSGNYLGTLKIYSKLEKQSDIDSLSLCALISMMTGDTESCDVMTLRAGSMGGRDYWNLSQEKHRNQLMSQPVAISSIWAPSILIARLDALQSLQSETYPPIESWMALCHHLSNPSESSFYFVLKSVRFLWTSTMVNEDVPTLANLLLAWLWQNKFDAEYKLKLIRTIHFSVTTALSSKEAEELSSFLKSAEH